MDTDSSDESKGSNSFGPGEDGKTTHGIPRKPRSPFHVLKLGQALVDVLLTIASLCFLIFACLVIRHHDAPAADPLPSALLEASRYGPTVFPIVFAAIVGRCLRSLAALKIEHGSSVLTIEYLLGCRTVFGAVTMPFELRAVHKLVLFLLALWAFSPLGGQASLRIIWTARSYSVSPGNFTYVAFASPFSNGGSGSPSVEYLGPINSLLTSALISTADTKRSPQDQYGNIKIPLYQNVQLGPVERNDPSWRPVPTDGNETLWSSLQGIPVHGMPEAGQTDFILNTGYMGADCKVSKRSTAPNATYWSLFHNETCMDEEGAGCWSGASYMLKGQGLYPGQTPVVTFTSFNNWAPDETFRLTIAECTISMNYVEAHVLCHGRSCHSDAIRPSQDPRHHDPILAGVTNEGINHTDYYSPINGLASSPYYLYLLANMVNATHPSSLCSESGCATSPLESYLHDPLNPSWGMDEEFPTLWKVGDEVFSQRFTQLLNTYWIATVAKYAVMGVFNLTTVYEASWTRYPELGPTIFGTQMSVDGYNLDWTAVEIRTPVEVIRCSVPWFVVLVIASLILVLAGIATAVLNILRKGPNYIDGFTSLLRWNRYVEIPEQHSLDDSVDIARRLAKTRVLFGDVKPHEEVGCAALTVMGEDVVVAKIERGKSYS